MNLKARLKEWKNPLPRLSKIPFGPPLLQEAVLEIQEKLQNISPVEPSKKDLNEIFFHVKNLYSSKLTLDVINTKYLRKIPWIVFTHPEREPGELGRNYSFSKDYLNWISHKRNTKALSILLYSFLLNYPVIYDTFDLWREGIKEALKASESPRIKLIKDRCLKYFFLSKKGPLSFSSMLVSENNNPLDILKQSGLTGQLEKKGFVVEAYKAFLNYTYKLLRGGEPQVKYLDKLFCLSVQESEKLRFETCFKDLAESLLMPYADRKASEMNREKIQSFILQYLGDPRFNVSGWIGVNDQAKDIMLSWLVDIHLKDFFNILSKTADDTWLFRKAFWESYLKRNKISDAWVVLGSRARTLASQHISSEKLYGVLRGAAPDQSVLLMKIDNLIIAEWSHSGSCRIWIQGAKGMPIMHYRGVYNAYDLREKPTFEPIRHYSSISGRWQEKVEHIIRYHTNIKVTKSEYMPNR